MNAIRMPFGNCSLVFHVEGDDQEWLNIINGGLWKEDLSWFDDELLKMIGLIL